MTGREREMAGPSHHSPGRAPPAPPCPPAAASPCHIFAWRGSRCGRCSCCCLVLASRDHPVPGLLLLRLSMARRDAAWPFQAQPSLAFAALLAACFCSTLLLSLVPYKPLASVSGRVAKGCPEVSAGTPDRPHERCQSLVSPTSGTLVMFEFWPPRRAQITPPQRCPSRAPWASPSPSTPSRRSSC